MRWTLAFVVACGSAPPPPAVIAHRAPPPTTNAGCDKLHGVVIDRATNDRAAGVTLVARVGDDAPAGEGDEMYVISDGTGRFSFDNVAPYDRLRVYYADVAYGGALPRRCDEITI